MRYLAIQSYKGNGIALNSRNQVLFSRTEYGPVHKTKYFLATGESEKELPDGFEPKLLNNSSQIVGYREGKIVTFENDAFHEIGTGDVYDLNNHGLIVGSTKRDGKTFPCIWNSDGSTWVGDEPGVATAVNDLGDYLVVETDDFNEYSYNDEEPFEISMPQFQSFCYSERAKIPLLGLDGENSRVKAVDIDNDRQIVGYSLHSSPEVEAHFDDEYGVPMYGGAPGSRSILWINFSANTIPQPAYSGGTVATMLGPNNTILGYSANGDLDFPTCTYALYEDDAFWNRGDVSHLLSKMTWLHPYMTAIHGINESGCILASNPSCQDLVLFEENLSNEQDYKAWEKRIYDKLANLQKEPKRTSFLSKLKKFFG
ncbi:MAG: hypothetical protein JST51_14440 [Armatimonadetes bacterium]|nr:hypothetical protein [Armatimonadota bacterium]